MIQRRLKMKTVEVLSVQIIKNPHCICYSEWVAKMDMCAHFVNADPQKLASKRSSQFFTPIFTAWNNVTFSCGFSAPLTTFEIDTSPPVPLNNTGPSIFINSVRRTGLKPTPPPIAVEGGVSFRPFFLRFQ